MRHQLNAMMAKYFFIFSAFLSFFSASSTSSLSSFHPAFGYRHIRDLSEFKGNESVASPLSIQEDSAARGVEDEEDEERLFAGDVIQYPIMFTSASDYLIAKMKLYGTFSIHFKLKTTQPNGVILFSGSEKDFMSLELFSGHLRYVFDVGSGIRLIQDRIPGSLNDNRWHEVTILRPSISQHLLRVDSVVSSDSLPDSRSVHYDLPHDLLYIGGIPRSVSISGRLPHQIKSQAGFQGCLASIDLDGAKVKLSDSKLKIPHEFKDSIKEECKGPSSECSPNTCQHNGICIQQWNGYTCNCDMTSFTGITCEQDSVSYVFGVNGGLIVFSLLEGERQDRAADSLAFGFQTTQRNAVFVRIVSATSSDFIEAHLVGGSANVLYNMGKTTHRIWDPSVHVDDGLYHVLQFTRSGSNSTLRIDDHPIQRKHPAGRQPITFNHGSVVYIGGRKESNGRIARSFHGTISGLTLNGQWLLELAADGDSRFVLDGDVEVNVTPLKMQSLQSDPQKRSRVSSHKWSAESINSSDSSWTSRRTNSPSIGTGDIAARKLSTSDILTSSDGSSCSDDHRKRNECRKSSGKEEFASTQPVIIRVFETIRALNATNPRAESRGTSAKIQPLRQNDNREEPCSSSDDDECEEQMASGHRNIIPSPPTHVLLNPVPGVLRLQDSDAQHNGDKRTEDLSSVASKAVKNTTTNAQSVASLDRNYFSAPIRYQWQTPFNPNIRTASGVRPTSLTTPVTDGPSSVKVTGSSSDGMTAWSDSTDDETGNISRLMNSAIGMNIGLIVGIASGAVLLLLVLAYAAYKYLNQEDCSYKLEPSDKYNFEKCTTKTTSAVKTCATTTAAPSDTNTSSTAGRSKKKQVKEWYV